MRIISDKLKSDVLVVSCDLVSEINLGSVLDIFRRHNASAATLFFHPQPDEHVHIPGPKTKHRPGEFIEKI